MPLTVLAEMTNQTLKSDLYEIQRMHNQRRQDTSSNSSHQMLPPDVITERKLKVDTKFGHCSHWQ